MRLDFNVLWVDDQPSRITAQIKRIKAHMVEQGFQFNPTVCSSLDEVREKISQDVFTDEVDLILVDWDLGNEIRGQDAITEIREKAQYKDVVFYSAQTTPDELREHANEAKLEGIFCASRETLVDDVIGVFDALVKKVLDLDHTRGIVMGATSDIDHIVNECIALAHRKLDGPGQQEMVEGMLQLVSAQAKKADTAAKEVAEAGTLDALLEARMIFTAYDRLRILNRTLKMTTFSVHKGSKPAIDQYMQRVVPDRNILGHQVLVPAGRPRSVVDAGGKEISLEETRELRRLILSLREQFRSLLTALGA